MIRWLSFVEADGPVMFQFHQPLFDRQINVPLSTPRIDNLLLGSRPLHSFEHRLPRR